MIRRLLPWLILLAAIAILASVYIYVTRAIQANEARVSRPKPPAIETPLSVSVIAVDPSRYSAKITAVGLAAPRYSLTLSNQVAGEVSKINSEFQVGEPIRKGQALIQLSNLSLKADLTSAKHSLTTSILALKEEERQVEQANAEWQAAGLSGTPASDLVLRQPQLAAAKADMDAAKASLALVQDNVSKLTVKAPFDGIVVSRNVAPGAYLNANSEIATLYSSDAVDIELLLSPQDWNKLPPAINMLNQKWPADITSIDNHQTWQGYVKQVGRHVNSASGLRSIFVSVDQPLEQTPALLPGSYVSVTLPGEEQDNLWQLPNSALSQKSEIWYVDTENRLANFETTPAFVDQHFVYVTPPRELASATQYILKQPYNSYLTGMLVDPKKSNTQ